MPCKICPKTGQRLCGEDLEDVCGLCQRCRGWEGEAIKDEAADPFNKPT